MSGADGPGGQPASPARSFLSLGDRATWVGGKGGVGKTTTAAALAVELAETGRSTLVVSTDPAHSLGDALGVALGGDPIPVPGVPGLRAMEIDARAEQARFLASHRADLLRLLERGSYLDDQDARGLVELTLPGLDELAALFRLIDLAAKDDAHLVVDTAPTGHTLRLLDLPDVARGWIAALHGMGDRQRQVELALVGRTVDDEAAALLNRLDDELASFQALLRDPDRTRFLLVTTREPVVLAETRRYEAALSGRGIALAGLVVNRDADPAPDQRGMIHLPAMAEAPTGLPGLRRFLNQAAPNWTVDAPDLDGLRLGGGFALPTDRVLYMVGGKGGVGKSTVAGALAVALARAGRRVLLLGIDPAGSLGEVLGMEVGAEGRAVPDAPGVVATQLQAESAWTALRDRFRDDAEALVATLAGGAAGAVDRMLELSPPGIDELVALMQVVDLAEDPPYDAVVLDTAPTGHLVRLLELPELVLEWTRALMRVLLKYRDVAGLGAPAERLLELARDLHALQDRLRDPSRTCLLAVALPDALNVPEAARLTARLRELGMPPPALLVNRLLGPDGHPRPTAVAHAGALARLAEPVAAAPALGRGPVGAAELARFADAWRTILPT